MNFQQAAKEIESQQKRFNFEAIDTLFVGQTKNPILVVNAFKALRDMGCPMNNIFCLEKPRLIKECLIYHGIHTATDGVKEISRLDMDYRNKNGNCVALLDTFRPYSIHYMMSEKKEADYSDFKHKDILYIVQEIMYEKRDGKVSFIDRVPFRQTQLDWEKWLLGKNGEIKKIRENTYEISRWALRNTGLRSPKFKLTSMGIKEIDGGDDYMPSWLSNMEYTSEIH